MRPIRKLLLRELLASLGLLIVLFGALVWFGMQGTLERQIEARTQESLLRLDRDLRSHLMEAERVGRAAAKWVEDGRAPLEQPLAVDGLLRPVLEESSTIVSMILIRADGGGCAFYRRPKGLDTYGLRSEPDQMQRTLFRSNGRLLDEPSVDRVPVRYRERPWFLAAQRSPLPQWVSVYPFLTAPDHGVSFVVPILDDRGNFKAAVCVDVLLETLSQRVWDTRPTPHSLALVCDSHTQVLVAPKDVDPQRQFLHPLGEGNLPLFHHLVQRWKAGGHSPELIRFTFENQAYAGRVLPMGGNRGADWLVCLAAPVRDFQQGVRGLVIVLALVGLVFLALLTWRLARLSKRITSPLASLAGAAEALGKGATPTPPDSEIQEIHTLGQAFLRAGLALEKDAELHLKLQHSQRLETVGTLAGGIAHDVNNQLAAILGQLNLGRDLLEPEHPAAQRIRKAEEAAQRCAQMLRSLLGFTHQTSPELESLDLNDLVRRTGNLVARLLGGCIRLDLELAADLAPVRGDNVSLEQVLMNLAVNARDAMPQGGRLLISTQALGGEICLTVKDTGTGIPEEILPKIFDPFFTTKEVGKGTGLGLAMVFGIVQAHGGRIEVDSQTGLGTEFRIWLASCQSQRPSAAAEIPTQDLDETSLAGRRVLVVEDEAPLRELMAEAFTARRAQVDAARDGAEGWALWKDGHYDLVISDQRMPELTGLELLARIRATESKVPVILASGYGLEGAEAELAKDPHLRILPKPFSLRRLYALATELGGEVPTSGR
jgi:signal transduction histidine kinase